MVSDFLFLLLVRATFYEWNSRKLSVGTKIYINDNSSFFSATVDTGVHCYLARFEWCINCWFWSRFFRYLPGDDRAAEGCHALPPQRRQQHAVPGPASGPGRRPTACLRACASVPLFRLCRRLCDGSSLRQHARLSVRDLQRSRQREGDTRWTVSPHTHFVLTVFPSADYYHYRYRNIQNIKRARFILASFLSSHRHRVNDSHLKHREAMVLPFISHCTSFWFITISLRVM